MFSINKFCVTRMTAFLRCGQTFRQTRVFTRKRNVPVAVFREPQARMTNGCNHGICFTMRLIKHLGHRTAHRFSMLSVVLWDISLITKPMALKRARSSSFYSSKQIWNISIESNTFFNSGPQITKIKMCHLLGFCRCNFWKLNK